MAEVRCVPGTVALFDGRIEGVAVHVGDRHARELSMARNTRGTAPGGARSGASARQSRQKLAIVFAERIEGE
jgi:hypothetical protein